MPVADRGGWRVDTNWPDEKRRFVFAAPCEGLREVAAFITEPRVFLKLCGADEEMRALLPIHWRLNEPNVVMTCERAAPESDLPAEYKAVVEGDARRVEARIYSEESGLAAQGYAARYNGVFIYDRIFVGAAHRRKGLGRALLAQLNIAAPGDRNLLVATPMGRQLYLSLGWRDCSPYATAVIPDVSA